VSVIAKMIGTEMVLLDYDRGIYYGLNPVGARIWQLLSDGKNESEIVELLAEEYDAERAAIAADVAALLRELRERGLLTETMTRR